MTLNTIFIWLSWKTRHLDRKLQHLKRNFRKREKALKLKDKLNNSNCTVTIYSLKIKTLKVGLHKLSIKRKWPVLKICSMKINNKKNNPSLKGILLKTLPKKWWKNQDLKKKHWHQQSCWSTNWRSKTITWLRQKESCSNNSINKLLEIGLFKRNSNFKGKRIVERMN